MCGGVKTSAGGPKATSRPLSRATSSKRCDAVSMSWVETRTVMPLRAEALEQLEHSLLGAHVDAGEGLVEQQDVRLLGQGAGEEDALLLPARELADGASGEVGDAELLEARSTTSRSAGCGRLSGPSRPYRPIMTTSRTVTGKRQSTSSRCGT